jgi:hypothetical protein
MVESRRYLRANLDPGYLINLRIGGQAFLNLPLNSLGLGGCSLTASEALVARAQEFTAVDEFQFDCDFLPSTTFKARVAWIAGRNPACLGVEFVDMPDQVSEPLSTLVHSFIHGTAGKSGY